jgi:hypothetical protein
VKIEDSKLPDRLKNALRRNGYFEYEEIKELDFEKLMSLRGIGKRMAEDILTITKSKEMER